jgi:hypothetical protein
VVTNLVTGHRNMIVMLTDQPGGQPVSLTDLAWAPDDTHLAVEVVYAAVASDVVFNAWTARTMRDGRTVPCPGGCAAKSPAYLRSGTLTYVTEQLSQTSSAITLAGWSGGRPLVVRVLPPVSVTQPPSGIA